MLRKKHIRIQTLAKFVYLYNATLDTLELPTVDKIMQYNDCCRSTAYEYLRALLYIFPERVLEQARKGRAEREAKEATIQQILVT